MKRRFLSTISLLTIFVMLFTGTVCAGEYPGSNITSNNIHDHVYSEKSRVSNSYIAVNADNTFSRIENFGDVILIETYDSSFKLKAQGTVNFELDRFGGFFDSGQYYYLLFGQNNYEQKDDQEVIRVVQYTKDWKRNDSFNIKGANTIIPFYGCNTDFSVNGDNLYIRCGHLSYKDKNGNSYQAAMTILMSQKTGEFKDIQSTAEGGGKGAVKNCGATFIDGTGEKLVAADHLCGNDETIYAMEYKNASTGDKFQSDCQYVKGLGSCFAVTDTVPDFSVGGMAVSSQNLIIAGNTVPSDSSSTARNIVIMTVPQNQFNEEGKNLSFITGFATSDAMSAQTPFIVKQASDRFCVLWEQKNGYSDTEKVYYVYIDGNGRKITEINSINGCLSDCQPVVFNDKIIWYTTNGAKTTIYSIKEGETTGSKTSSTTNTVSTGNTVYNGTDYSRVYDFSYYCNRYPDIRVLYKNNPAGALAHFVNTGMGEGRQGNEEFNLGIYQSNYPELKQQYGDARASYYYHYMTVGYAAGYNARTSK